MFPLELIHEKIVAAKLRHLLIGGQALNTYGSPRATLDVDFLIPETDRDAWQRILSEEGFTLKNDGGSFRQYAPPYQMDWPLDLMIVNESTFEEIHTASNPVECLGIKTQVPSPEHLIALKVHAIQHGPAARMEKDFPDIVRLARTTKLDPDSAAIRRISTVTETKNSMSDSHDPPKSPADEMNLNDSKGLYDLDLPVAPAWFSDEPAGSWEAGYRMSLEVLRSALKRPEIWAERDRLMVAAEFICKED